mmetsp:Transcript_65415/g.173399  ORF Transcript_65415/g.173399 Transcript_65415/m.173399 type:complete len:325 (-) Transcript_65415:277-1251(-)
MPSCCGLRQPLATCWVVTFLCLTSPLVSLWMGGMLTVSAFGPDFNNFHTESETIPPVPEKVIWLHPPKTGSSFAVPVFELGCRSCEAQWKGKDLGQDPGDWFKKHYPTTECCTKYMGMYHHLYGHDPLMHISNAPMVLMMLREPHRRLQSDYVYAYDKSHLHMIPSVSKFSKEVIEALRRQAHNTRLTLTDRLLAFEGFPGIAHCQTKMILGRLCYAQFFLTPQLSEKAIGTMKKFAFVGDTDRWSTSMCVLARKFRRPDLEKFNLNSRKTTTPRSAPRRERTNTSFYAQVLASRTQVMDWADNDLFAASTARLDREALHYGCA